VSDISSRVVRCSDVLASNDAVTSAASLEDMQLAVENQEQQHQHQQQQH
jgi:hypothetical protein